MYRGVSWHKGGRKWQAHGQLPAFDGKEGQRVHLGYFVDEVAAARAYDRFAVDQYGEFASLNVPADNAMEQAP